MADGYTPTTEGLVDLLLANDPSFGPYKRQHWQRVVRDEISPWLDAHDAQKRAEWEAEQGQVEWEYGYELIESDTRDVLTRGFSYDTAREAGAVSRRRAIEEHDPDYPALEPLVVKRRKAGPWLPVDENGTTS